MAVNRFELQFNLLVELAGGTQGQLAEEAGAAGQSTVAMWLKNQAVSKAAIKRLRAKKKFSKCDQIDWAVLAGL